MFQPQIDYEPLHRRPSNAGVIIRRVLRRWWPILAAIPVLFGFAAWEAFGLHVDEPVGFSPPSVVADYTGATPPPTATHIRTASFRQGRGFSNYGRFEAPVNNCLSFAEQLCHGAQLPLNSHLPPDPRDVDRPYFKDLSWLDISNIVDPVGFEPGPEIWVDRSRGVFYYYNGF